MSQPESFKSQKIQVQTQLQIGESAITRISTNKNTIIDRDKIWIKKISKQTTIRWHIIENTTIESIHNLYCT